MFEVQIQDNDGSWHPRQYPAIITTNSQEAITFCQSNVLANRNSDQPQRVFNLEMQMRVYECRYRMASIEVLV